MPTSMPSAQAYRRHQKWMQRALELARKAEGDTHPNPPVGCIIVKGNRLISEGFHKKAGGDHAERAAVKSAKNSLVDATIYITLEPCSSHGRTPPCTDLILESGISTVVIGTRDPDPRHRGRGVRLLQKAGIQVIENICQSDAKELLEPFSTVIALKRPFVTLKVGMSLDGKLSDSHGQSKWITGQAARREVQALRRRVDGIVVGVGTILADNPSLLCRKSRSHRLTRLILDSRGRTPLDAVILSDDRRQDTIIVTTERAPKTRRKALEACGAKVWVLPQKEKRVSVKALARRCAREGLLHLLIEGGGELAASWIQAGLVDEYQIFIAPKFIGGRTSTTAMDGHGFALGQALECDIVETRPVGDDILIRSRPKSQIGRG